MNTYPHVTALVGATRISGTLKAVEINQKKYLILISELSLREQAGIGTKAVAQALVTDPEDAIMAAVVGVGTVALKAVVSGTTGTDLSHVKTNNSYAQDFSSWVSIEKKVLTPEARELLRIDMSTIERLESGSLVDRYVWIGTRYSQYKLLFGGVKRHFDCYKDLCAELGWN